MRTLWTDTDVADLREFVRVSQPFSLLDWEPFAQQKGRTVHACRLKAQKEGLHGVLARASRLTKSVNVGVVKPKRSDNVNIDNSPQEPTDGNTNVTHISPLGPSARSEAEMLALFQVDVTRWEVVKLSHNVWEVGQKGPDGEPVVQPLCQTTLHLKLIEGHPAAWREEILAAVRAEAPPRSPAIRVKRPTYLGEFCAPDKHLAKLGWSAETESSPYDMAIAQERYRDAMADLFVKTSGFPLAEILIPAGNDEQHIDNLRSETTSGTRVDSDSRLHKMFRAAVEDRIWVIKEALTRAAKVVELTVPGNHDRVGAFAVGEVVRAYFANEPRVVFDNEPPLRKYYRWGKTLLGYTHGSEEKHRDLPLIMAQERPQDWAETTYRLWRLGHLHKRSQSDTRTTETYTGVEVRIIASLSGTDAWHYGRGYVQNRPAAEAFVHHLEEGEVGAFISRLPQT